MSCTFWNMRRRKAQKKKKGVQMNTTPETNGAKKPVKKTAVKKASAETAVTKNDE